MPGGGSEVDGMVGMAGCSAHDSSAARRKTNILLASTTDDRECDIFARAACFRRYPETHRRLSTRWPSTATMRSAALRSTVSVSYTNGPCRFFCRTIADAVEPGLLGGSAGCHRGDQEPPLALIDARDASVGAYDMPALNQAAAPHARSCRPELQSPHRCSARFGWRWRSSCR